MGEQPPLVSVPRQSRSSSGTAGNGPGGQTPQPALPPAWTPPTPARIRDSARRLGLGLSAAEVRRYARLAPQFAAAHHTVAHWWHADRPEQAEVGWRWGSDPWNATEVEIDAAADELSAVSGGPLAGLRVAVKSTIAVAGVPLGAGSRLVEGHIPGRSATVVDRARAAGAVVTHTGRTDDLCLAITGDRGAAGPVLNPWSTDGRHTTWGSSAGAAALVAAGRVQAAILVDQAGSGRVPGAGCGLVVLLPTRGLVPTTGTVGFTTVQDRIAVAALRTATVARLASVLSGGDGRDLKQGPDARSRDWTGAVGGGVAGLRVGVVAEAFTEDCCDPAVAAAVHRQAATLADRGAHVTEVGMPRYRDAAALAMLLTVHAGVPDLLVGHLGSTPAVLGGDAELARQVADRRAAHPEWLAETVKVSAVAAGDDGGRPAGLWRALVMELIPELTAAYDHHFHGPDAVDVLLTPTVHTTPPTVPGPDMTADQLLARALGPGITHTCGANLTGHPAIQIPAGLVDRLPVGAQVIALHLREDLCLRVAAALEPAGGFPPAPTHPEAS